MNTPARGGRPRATAPFGRLGRETGWIAGLLLGLCLVAAFGSALFASLVHAADAPAAAPAPAGAPAAPTPAPVGPQTAEEKAASNERCLGCHDDAELKTDAGKSLAVHAADFGASAHKRIACVECHSDALTVKHPRNDLGPVSIESCRGCHEEEMTALAGSVHGQKGVEPKACIGCHGSVHEVLKSSDPKNSMALEHQAETCGRCHEGMMKGWHDSVHAKGLLKSGLASAPTCASCHGAHDILAHANPESRTSFGKLPETCGSCHVGVLREWKESVHGELWAADRADAPTCATCHDAHKVQAPTTAAMRKRMPDDCGNCHAELYATFHDGFHGKSSAIGRDDSAMCSDCHTPHHNLPASNPASSIHPDNLGKTCGACHEKEAQNASFLTYAPHIDPTKPDDNVWVHYIWLFMTGLLLGVFGFFGLHALLWFQRSLVGKLRGEFKAGHHGSGPYVRRFSTLQIWLHVTIVLSFLLLAATGLPLKFAGAPWAETLANLLGGAASAAWLHRFAAVVTFGYFAVHIGQLIHGMFVRKEKGYLWGWRSMTPNLQDVKDMAANVRYFLYAGPRPKFDRWTYWEKFDYLAVFWGVAMIGVSGLMLWFPGFFTTFLPGWALNAAYVIHSDEALLATGFIFLFHFFHTHLRPESFPMDPVVFTGRMPLERFKDERPLEYERLVKENRLEQFLVPAPTSGQLARWHVFGFTAVAIGIALAIAIFVGLIKGYGL